MLLVTRGMLVNPCLPLYAMMTNVDSCSLTIATTAWWSLESSFLQERRHQEKERLEAYLETEEHAIAARTMQCDKATKERGGSTQDISSRMVWIPPPDHYFG
jgi:hypothetical protein